MKGQAIFEFIVAAILFFGVVFYVITFLSTTVSDYSMESKLNNMESEAFSLSEYMVNIRLADEWPVMSYDKLQQFNQSCNNDYMGMMSELGIGVNRDMKVKVTENNRTIVDCSALVKIPDVERAEVKRYALSQNESIMTVTVTIWGS